MSRARYHFLRMLLPSGNSRVSVTLNSLIRALFRRGFFPRALSQGLLLCAISVRRFAGAFSVRSFAGAFFRALFRRGFFSALIQTGVLTHGMV